LIEQRGHHLDVDAPPHAVLLDADEARLTQVFANLVTNAAKYTDRGGHLHVGVQQVGDEVVIAVRDDGIGIDAALLPRVFELFVQGYQSSERAVGGPGLGLTLVRALVDLHGGHVEAHSAGLGAGSTFTVRLPVVDVATAEVVPQARPTELEPPSKRRRILVVDDNEDACLLLAEVLQALGHDVRTAGDGPAALELVTAWKPQVAILDIGLPVMDGFELASRLRAELAPPPRLIALTGYGQPNDRERTRPASTSIW